MCDAGPVLHLSEASALGLLERLGEIFIPTAVDQEVARYLADWPARRPDWIRVQSPPDLAPGAPALWAGQIDMGLGEIEAILLARSLAADWLLTDDAAARVVATLLAIEVHGSLGVVLWAATQRQINPQEAAAILERLAKSSLWVSPAILAEARRALNTLQG